MARNARSESTSDSELSSSSESNSPKPNARSQSTEKPTNKMSGKKSMADKKPIETADSSVSKPGEEQSDSSESGSEDDNGSSSAESSDKKVPASNSSREEDESSFSGGDKSKNEDGDGPSPGQEADAPLDKSKKKVAFRSSQTFNPPTGFKQAKKSSAPSSGVSSLLSNLRGKQIFHVTAPASLPISKIKEVSIAKVIQGEPVLTHEGVKYGIPADSFNQQNDGAEMVLLYDPKSETYYNSPARNIQSYNIQEMVSLPKEFKSNDRASAESGNLIKPQPKHLKMRFRPVGSGNGPSETIGTSSEESEGEEPTFKFPKGSNKEREERKRKHELITGDGSQPGGLPRKKSKKHSSFQGAENGPSPSQMEQAPGSPESERGREKSGKSHKKRNETSQERKARREKKRKKAATGS